MAKQRFQNSATVDGFPEFCGSFVSLIFSLAFSLDLALFGATWPGVDSVRRLMAEFIFDEGSRSKGLGSLAIISAIGSKFERGGFEELILTQVEGRTREKIISKGTIRKLRGVFFVTQGG